MRQLPDQPIDEFLSQMQAIWDQLALAEPTWENAKDAEKYFKYRDNLRVLHFLMVLVPKYEPVRASILHRGSLPSLESAVFELLSEETRLSILKGQPTNSNVDTNIVLAMTSNSTRSKKNCNYCKRSGHTISECRKLQYKNNKGSGTQFKGRSQNRSLHTTGAVTDDSSPTFSLSELQSILKQVSANSANSIDAPTSALSITPGTSNGTDTWDWL